MWVYGLDWAGPGYRQVADACECGNEPSGSVKCGVGKIVFLDIGQGNEHSCSRTPLWCKGNYGRF